MKKIFISYRRAEAAFAAGALARDLREHFGDQQVFRDKEDIGGGELWKQEIIREINTEVAMLVLIGENWLSAKNSQGELRLNNPEDPIRLEIAVGLANGARVIPVLLEDAVMPREAELPEDLRKLTQYNALRLRDGDWQYDLSKVFKTLDKIGFLSLSPNQTVPVNPVQGQRGMPLKLISSYILSGLTLLGLYGEDGSYNQDTYYGFVIFGSIAIALAGFTYRDFRQGKTEGQWKIISAIALSTLLTIYCLGVAPDAPPASLPEQTEPGNTNGQL